MATKAQTKPLVEIIAAHLDGRPLKPFVEASGIQRDRFRRIIHGEANMRVDEVTWFAKRLGMTADQVIASIPAE